MLQANLFRPYSFKHDRLSRETFGKSQIMEATINLFDVDSWSSCDNMFEGFNDNVSRTIIFCAKDYYYAHVKPEKFKETFYNFLMDHRAGDMRSVILPDRETYSGPMKVHVKSTQHHLYVTFHRKSFTPTTMEDAIFNCLFSVTTPMN